ncbi:MAG: OmpH family outer membrane protein, partial [Muribaculaceae bacterium]|nr:OmpH family outer membrane protein [Muribaculaceae bacterium]
IKPIQDEIYNACKKVCEDRGYQVIFDRASIQGAIYVSPRIDVTEEVISKLGY